MSRSNPWLLAAAFVVSAGLLAACEKETRVEKSDTVVVPPPKTAEPAPGPAGPAGPPGPAGAPGPTGEPGTKGDSGSTTVVVPPPAPPPEPAKEPEKK